MMKKTVTLLLIMLISIAAASFAAACGISNDEIQEQVSETEEESTEAAEESENEVDTEMVTTIAKILNCPDYTAEEICKDIVDSIPEKVSGIVQVEDPYSKVLEISGESGRKYYAVVEKGFFLSRITADSMRGERLYFAIQ